MIREDSPPPEHAPHKVHFDNITLPLRPGIGLDQFSHACSFGSVQLDTPKANTVRICNCCPVSTLRVWRVSVFTAVKPAKAKITIVDNAIIFILLVRLRKSHNAWLWGGASAKSRTSLLLRGFDDFHLLPCFFAKKVSCVSFWFFTSVAEGNELVVVILNHVCQDCFGNHI